jgi:hypothetical protein
MPIRVNLKEIFPADSQEITVDKVNFNFNKLLELGVGDTGPQGVAGPQGAAGPTGLTGPEGQRGNEWLVDAVDPNTLTIPGLIDGDLYLNSATFDVWQYDETSSTWSIVSNIGTVINTYLSNAGSPFVRGSLGTSSPLDTRFITFAKRGDTYLDHVGDAIAGSLNASDNDILFLNNFDEDVLLNEPSFTPTLDFPVNIDTLFNSLLAIYVDHTQPVPAPTADQYGRYHIELGALYQDSENAPLESRLSAINTNLKIKFLKKDVSGSTSIPSTNYWINTAKFSLAPLEASGTGVIDQNARFDFVLPKYNNEDILNVVKDEVTVALGSAESLIELGGAPSIMADGIAISANYGMITMGILENLEALLPLPYSSGDANFGFFNLTTGLDGFFFNNTIVQTGGSITQLITNELGIVDDLSWPVAAVTTTNHYMNQGIFIGSNSIWTASGAGNTTSTTSVGVLARFDITNVIDPESTYDETGTQALGLLGTTGVDQHGHTYRDENGIVPKKLGLIKDVAEFGKYIVTVNGRSVSSSPSDFAIYETDSRFNQVNRIGGIFTDPQLEDAYRVHVNGRYAWVITNSTITTGPQVPGSPTQARLTAVDLLDPANPVIVDSFQDAELGSKYLDFKIYDNKAIVLRYTNYYDSGTPANSAHQLDLLTFDIFDPTSFSSITFETVTLGPPPSFPITVNTVPYSPQDTQLLASLTVNTTRTEYGSVSVQGRDVYVAWENSLYIVELDTASDLRSTTLISGETVYANDVVVRGRYAYVLVNYTDSTGAVQVYDISDKTSPLLVSETREAQLRNSSRLAINGKNIYIVSTQSGNRARLITLNINGIESPGANLGSTRTSDLHVIGNAHIKNNLQVKNSVNVGPGGLHIDEGVGLSSDSLIETSSNLGVITNILSDTTDDVYGHRTLITRGISLENVTGHSTVLEYATVLNSFTGIDLSITGTIGSGAQITTDVVGLDFTVSRYSNIGGSIYGSRIAIQPIPAGDVGDDSYGYYITSSADMDTNKSFYGFYVNLAGTNVSGVGKAYGIYAAGSTDNYLEGTTTIDDVLALTPRASDPSPATNGMIYYNSGTNKLRLYAGGAWTNLN